MRLVAQNSRRFALQDLPGKIGKVRCSNRSLRRIRHEVPQRSFRTGNIRGSLPPTASAMKPVEREPVFMTTNASVGGGNPIIDKNACLGRIGWVERVSCRKFGRENGIIDQAAYIAVHLVREPTCAVVVRDGWEKGS